MTKHQDIRVHPVLRLAVAVSAPFVLACLLLLAFSDSLAGASTIGAVLGRGDSQLSQSGDIYVDGADTIPDDAGCGDFSNPCNTVQKGIDVAVSGDRVHVAPFVYHEHLRINKNVSVLGDEPTGVVLDGDGVRRVITVFNQASAQLVDMEVRNGRAVEGGGINVGDSSVALIRMRITDNTATVEGGGIYVGYDGTAVLSRTLVSNNQVIDPLDLGRGGGGIVSLQGSTLTVSHSNISGNRSNVGGGIACLGSLTLAHSTIAGNTTTGNGGGVWTSGSADINWCQLIGNLAVGSDAQDGGAIYNSGEGQVSYCSFSSNQAGRNGGAIHNEDGTLLLAELSIGKGAATKGAGLYNSNGAGVDASEVTFSGNSAVEGGGALNEGSLALTNVTFSDNRATGDGGGMLNASSTSTLLNVTLTNNIADFDADGTGSGGGLAQTGGTVQILNSLVAANLDNSPGIIHPDCSGDFESRGYNLVGINAGCAGFASAEHDIVGTLVAPIEPLLDILGDNGGHSHTHALLTGSPAIDAGDDDSCPVADQRGADRPLDGDGDGAATCDIGAYERGMTVPTNTSTATTTNTPTASATITPTITLTPSVTPTASDTPTVTPRPTRTFTHTPGPSPTRTPSATVSRTPTTLATPSATATQTSEPTPTDGGTVEPTATSDGTTVPTGTETATVSATGSATGPATEPATPSPSATGDEPSPTDTATPAETPSATSEPGGAVYLPFLLRT